MFCVGLYENDGQEMKTKFNDIVILHLKLAGLEGYEGPSKTQVMVRVTSFLPENGVFEGVIFSHMIVPIQGISEGSILKFTGNDIHEVLTQDTNFKDRWKRLLSRSP